MGEREPVVGEEWEGELEPLDRFPLVLAVLGRDAEHIGAELAQLAVVVAKGPSVTARSAVGSATIVITTSARSAA